MADNRIIAGTDTGALVGTESLPVTKITSTGQTETTHWRTTIANIATYVLSLITNLSTLAKFGESGADVTFNGNILTSSATAHSHTNLPTLELFEPTSGGLNYNGVQILPLPTTTNLVAFDKRGEIAAGVDFAIDIIYGELLAIHYLKVSGSPVLEIGTTAGGNDILNQSLAAPYPIQGSFNFVQPFGGAGQLFVKVSGSGAVNLTFEYSQNIFS